MRDAATGLIRGRVSIVGMRLVTRIYHASGYSATELGAILDMKDLDLKPEPTLDDVAAYLRPGKEIKVGTDIFKQDKSLKPRAGKDGVEYWGWFTQNKNQGLKSDWVFVAVQEVEQ